MSLRLPVAVSRRTVLLSTAVAGGAILFRSGDAAAAYGAFPDVGDWSTCYEPTGQDASFRYDTAFHRQVGAWVELVHDNTPANMGSPGCISSYGAYVDKPGAHGQGRALDVAGLRLTVDGRLVTVADGRYDRWRATATPALYRRYWALAASLNHEFRHVLHYEYNAEHHNHLHVDNLLSARDGSTFDAGSSAQVQFVQAALTHVWEAPGITVDGEFGPATRKAVGAVLVRTGGPGELAVQRDWRRFCLATMRRGFGTQTY